MLRQLLRSHLVRAAVLLLRNLLPIVLPFSFPPLANNRVPFFAPVSFP